MTFSAKEMIKQRKSVRTFDGKTLSDEDRRNLENYIHSLANPFNVPVDFRLLDFSILKRGGSIVSLRGLPNGEFAARSGMSFVKRMMFGMAGRKYDKMAAAKGQKYFFIFVHEDGTGLERISEIFKDTPIEASVDEVFSLDEVNDAMKKVASGGSRGKTILKIA